MNFLEYRFVCLKFCGVCFAVFLLLLLLLVVWVFVWCSFVFCGAGVVVFKLAEAHGK